LNGSIYKSIGKVELPTISFAARNAIPMAVKRAYNRKLDAPALPRSQFPDSRQYINLGCLPSGLTLLACTKTEETEKSVFVEPNAEILCSR
jgi:hypothetical protein